MTEGNEKRKQNLMKAKRRYIGKKEEEKNKEHSANTLIAKDINDRRK